MVITFTKPITYDYSVHVSNICRNNFENLLNSWSLELQNLSTLPVHGPYARSTELKIILISILETQ